MLKRTLIVALLVLSACMPNYSDGTRAGVVTKLSHKGLIFKSWEGELQMGGLAVGGVPNTFRFNADEAAVEKLQAAMVSGQRVELAYHQYALSPPSIDSDYVVTDVK